MLQAFFDWMGQWPISQAIGASIWIFPLIQAIHLVFLALFAGGMIIVDLRLLGYGMRSKTVAQVARDARPWMIAGFLGLVVHRSSAIDAERLSRVFQRVLLVQDVPDRLRPDLHLTVRRKMTQANETTIGRKGRRAHLDGDWTGVTINARLIGLFT